MTPYGNRKPRGDVKRHNVCSFTVRCEIEGKRKRDKWKMERRVSEKWRERERERERKRES